MYGVQDKCVYGMWCVGQVCVWCAGQVCVTVYGV